MRANVEVYNYLNEIYKELAGLDKEVKLHQRKVVIFGVNDYTGYLCKWLRTNNITVEYLLDNDSSKWGKLVEDVVIISPYELQKPDASIFVLIYSAHYEAMRQQLEQFGYTKEQIYFIRSFNHKNKLRAFPIKQGNWYIPSLSEVQRRTLEVLEYVIKVCEENGIRYYMAFGTLLGAVRHQGMIPWDDDVDLFMLMPDFWKFCDIMTKDEHYGIWSTYTQNEEAPSVDCIAKIMDLGTMAATNWNPLSLNSHIAVDIFPLGGYPSDKREQEQFWNELQEIAYMWYYFVVNNYGTSLYSYKVHTRMAKKMKNIMNRYDYDTSEYVGHLSCSPFPSLLTKKSFYDNCVRLSYDSKQLPAPSNYKEILSGYYGDYMSFPPLEKRQPEHFFDCKIRYD